MCESRKVDSVQRPGCMGCSAIPDGEGTSSRLAWEDWGLRGLGAQAMRGTKLGMHKNKRTTDLSSQIQANTTSALF